MNRWLVFIKSQIQWQDLEKYIYDNEGIYKTETGLYGVVYYVIDSPIKRKDLKLIGKKDETLVAASFQVYGIKPIRRMIKKGITEIDNVIRLDLLHPDERVQYPDERDFECYIKKGKNFFSKKELLNYLSKIKYKFKKNDH